MILTAAQMREADRRCIEDIGIPGVVLMNTAGARVFEQINRGPVGIVCGKGNNGGDGYVIARMALDAGFDTRLVLLTAPESVTGDAAVFLDAYLNLGGDMIVVRDDERMCEALDTLSECSVLVDAVLGTGISGEVRGMARTTIDNWPEVYTVAVDLPSGLNADTGEICGNCIRADITVTFQCAKPGLLVAEAKPYVGRLVVADIGIPKVCLEE